MVLREPKAVKELESLNLELTRASTELASLQAALAESGRRAEKAKAENAAKSEADRAKPILERLEQRGKAMDEAAALYKQHYVGAEQDLDELRRIGIGAPGRALAISNFRHCYDSAMQGLDVKTAVIPPQRRRGWEGGVRWTSAAARLFLRACTHRRSMSAFGGKADMATVLAECPLYPRKQTSTVCEYMP